ncbi:MAG TPA: cobalt ECF transporter T component CbiQ [Gammaproteobacteria bacterium]|nr:cobalt ECF transporter T component CbiQ [Gammaproteobacteria bacterium]
MPLDIDRYAHLASPLQRWDPRYKIAALGTFVVCVALVKNLPLAFISLLLSMVLLYLSKLPRHFVSHGLFSVMAFLLPFFLIMPFTYYSPDHAHFWGMTFSFGGLRMALLIFIKAIAIVTTSFVVFGTSRFDVSMIALQHLKCPKVLTQMLLFTYRYIFTFMEEMKRMRTSMAARGFVPKANGNTFATYGNFVGTLLVRSFERTERIYKAMLSKGYQGEFHSLVEFKADITDKYKLAGVIMIAVFLFSIELVGNFTPAELAWY